MKDKKEKAIKCCKGMKGMETKDGTRNGTAEK